MADDTSLRLVYQHCDRDGHFEEVKHVGIWHPYESGELAAVVQLVLTSLFVGIFVTINSVSIARAAFVPR